METPQRQESVEETIVLDETCGFHVNYGCIKKKSRYPVPCLQRFAKPQWALTFLSCLGFLQGFVISGMVNVIVTTIEKRFGLSSSEAGLIISSYNIASCLVIPFITYVGGRGNKPLWVGWGMVLMGIGCITFSLPHFLSEPYTFISINEESYVTCAANGTRGLEQGSNNVYKYIFIFAQCLNGIGTSSLYTLGMTYLDESVEKKFSSLHHGIYFSIAAALGPAAGYLIGGFTLKVYTEIGETPGITNDDPAWVGAWWIGFLVPGLILLLLSVPVLMLPPRMPNTGGHSMQRSSEMHQDSMVRTIEKDINFGKTLKDLPKSLLILLRNPAFLFVSLANALDFGLTSGFAAFTPKYLESVFSLTATEAAYYLGIVVIVGGSLGYVVGGIIISKGELTVRGMILLCIGSAIAALICAFGYFYSCVDTAFAGATIPYSGSNEMSSTNFKAQCNQHCDCSTDIYKPVCGADGTTYFSSCFAGCTGFENGIYTNCSCIQGNNSFIATTGKCIKSNCGGLVGFLLAMFGLLFFTVLCWTPALQIVVRVVPFSQRSFAVGMKWVLYRCFGGIPVPIIFGKVFDLACAVWSSENGEQASCRLYYNNDMGKFFLYLIVAHKVLTTGFYVLVAFLYVPPENEKSDVPPDFVITTSATNMEFETNNGEPAL